MANLGNDQQGAHDLVTSLISADWLNRDARALMVEFNVLNANTNLFNYVIICVEFLSNGGILLSNDIDTIVLYR